MEISRTAVGFILAAGVAAGAGGAYFAKRSADVVETPVAASMDGTGGSVSPGDVIAEAPVPAVERTDVRAASRARAIEPRPRTAEPPAVVSRAEPAPAPVEERAPAPAPVADVAAPVDVAPAVPPAPAGPELIELVVSADSVIGLQLATSVTSERARVEDAVEASVVRDVRVGDRVAIPAGSRVHGEVTVVERGGRLKERARLGVRFTSLALPDGTRIAIQTEPIFREGESQAASSSAKIGGGAIGGAILGGILGGAKGAAIGGSVGAGAGTAAVMAGSRNQATLPAGSPVTVRVEQPIVITMER